ncbi:MAG: alpha-galactosidase [Anaerolineae bacterium]
MTITSVEVDGRPMWVLETEQTGMGLSIGPHERLQLDHWGERLVRAEDYRALSHTFAAASFGPELDHTPLAYPVFGDPTFKEPALAVTYHDGVRAADLRFVTANIADDAPTLELVFEDAVYGLRVIHCFEVHAPFDLISRSVRLENHSSDPLKVNAVASAALAWTGGEYELFYLHGMWGAETHLETVPLRRGKFTLDSRRGHTSHYANPWFAVAPAGETSESAGRVWFGELAWSGNWAFTFESEAVGSLHFVGGLNPFDFAWDLMPGETFTTPPLVCGYAEGGLGTAARSLHAYQRACVLPASLRAEPRPVVYNSWEAVYFNVNTERLIDLAQRVAPLGIETFVVDDGWFGERNLDIAGLGDWFVNPAKFPQGLTPLIDEVHRLGMQFGIWVEPEMVNPDSDLYRAHPDWIIHFATRERTLLRTQSVLNFGREDVRQHILGMLQKLLRENDISYIKWDMNRPFTEPGWPGWPRDQRELWVRHVWGLYEVMGALRAEFPRLILQSCSGGGGRVDMGVMRYTDEFWVSDNTEAWDRLIIQHGFSHGYPAKTMACHVSNVPNHQTGRVTPLAFRFHVAMQGRLGMEADVTHWPDADLAEARDLIAQYKRVRPIIQEGDQYWLVPPAEFGLAAVEYVAKEQDAAVVLVYLPRMILHRDRQLVPLRGLDPTRIYCREGDGLALSGRALMTTGAPVQFQPRDFASEMQVWRAE